MNQQRIQSNRGMTLLEVAMAGTVVLFGFIGFMQALTIGSAMQETARNQTIAVQILQNRLNELRLMPWDGIVSKAATLPKIKEFELVWEETETPDETDIDYPFKDIAVGFEWRYEFYDQTNVNEPNVQLSEDIEGELDNNNTYYIRVVVRWPNRTSAGFHTRSSETFLIKKGLNESHRRP